MCMYRVCMYVESMQLGLFFGGRTMSGGRAERVFSHVVGQRPFPSLFPLVSDYELPCVELPVGVGGPWCWPGEAEPTAL